MSTACPNYILLFPNDTSLVVVGTLTHDACFPFFYLGILTSYGEYYEVTMANLQREFTEKRPTYSYVDFLPGHDAINFYM